MARLNLKNILSPKTDAFALVSSLVRDLGARIYIEDSNGKVLVGTANLSSANEEAVKLDDEIIGWVKGDDKVPVMHSLVNMLIQKEAERKKLGSEVLTLYQEVNLIFNFSERLAQTIGQQAIAGITLDEAHRLVKSDHGVVILWDAATRKIEVLAEFGVPVFNHDKLSEHTGLFINTSNNGQSDIMGDLTPLKHAGVILPEVQSLLYAALKVKHRVMGAIILASSEPIQYAAADLKFLITLALQSSSAIESALLYERSIREAKEREEAMRRVYEVTNKFVPHEFIRSLGRDVITDIQLGDQVEKIVTVLFSDIRGYTTLAEQMTPDENFRFVCSFNERIGPIIREHGGFINQYLGDAIMAIFPGRASDALSAAIKMQAAVETLNATRVLENKSPIRIGVGMHTGPLIMGITGDNERLDATTIADAVNTASRLESLTKHYKANILLSEASVKDLANPDMFHLRHLGSVQVKGKLAPISIHECISGTDQDDLEKKISALPIFRAGMKHYFDQSFGEATDHFSRVLEIYPEDSTTQIFLLRAKEYSSAHLPANWTGVEEMSSK